MLSLSKTFAAAAVSLAALAPAAHAQTPPPSPTTFQVVHNDHIGAVAINAGYYTLTPTGGMTAAQASTRFAQFLQDFDGKLPSPWVLNGATTSFTRTDTGTGFSYTPIPTPAPAPTPVPTVPGTVCPGVFEVEHNDRIGNVAFPQGDYQVTTLRGTCASSMASFKRLLARSDQRLPSPWTLNAQTGTFGTSGAGARFRVKPVA